MRRLAALSAALLLAACGQENARDAARPNVLLVTIDTLRADRVHARLTPALARLGDGALRFTAARTAVPLTLPSHATILTGLLPPVHGVRDNGAAPLDASHATVATALEAAGYRTAAFVGAFVLDRRFGLGRGFDTYDDRIPRDPRAPERLEAERPASAVVDAALAWLGSASTGAEASSHESSPFFAWIHLYDPHAPYAPPVQSGLTGYDAEVAYADAQIARVFDWLRQRALAERTLIVVTGDHGEGLGQHGERTHGMLLYDSTLRVPLIISVPGRAPAQRDDPATLADLAPTILGAVGVAVPKPMTGRDLLRTSAPRATDDLYSETEYPRVAGWSPLQALTDGRWVTIRAAGSSEVYDVARDPDQLHDIASVQPTISSAMSSRIDRIRARSSAAPRQIAPDVQERLRALGYVSGSTPAPLAANAPDPSDRIATWSAFEDVLSAEAAGRPEVVALARRLAMENPGAQVFQTTYGRALKDAGQVDAAVAVYRAAASRWPNDPWVFHDLAVVARQAAAQAAGRNAVALRDEAVRAEQAALALSPNSAAAHNGLGLLAIDAGRPADALAAFERATRLDPGNGMYWANLGNARRATGDGAGAEQAYRRALDVDGRIADAANGLGVLLVESKRPADAIPWFERALAVSPDFVEAKLNLGIALQESGARERAADVYRAVLKSPARHRRERDAAARLLASLGSR